jgi:hypothetical protein
MGPSAGGSSIHAHRAFRFFLRNKCRCNATSTGSETGGLEDYAKLPAELPVMRKMFDIQPGFM